MKLPKAISLCKPHAVKTSPMDVSFIKALDIIADISPIEKKSVGDIMIESGIISSNEFIYIHDDNAILLHSSNENNQMVAERWKTILSFIGLIQNLKKENLIFLQPVEFSNWVYGAEVVQYSPCQNPYEYDLGSNIKLKRTAYGFIIETNDYTYSEVPINSEISKELHKYLSCLIYPGKDFEIYRDRGYISPMEYSLNLSRKANKWAYLAFFVAIVSFILSPFLFNWWGYSTINEDQFKQLIDSISKYGNKHTIINLSDSPANRLNDSSSISVTEFNSDVLRKKEKR